MHLMTLGLNNHHMQGRSRLVTGDPSSAGHDDVRTGAHLDSFYCICGASKSHSIVLQPVCSPGSLASSNVPRSDPTGLARHKDHRRSMADALAPPANAGHGGGGALPAWSPWPCGLPAWATSGFKKGSMARSCEEVQHRPFLVTGRPPAVGQALYCQVRSCASAHTHARRRQAGASR